MEAKIHHLLDNLFQLHSQKKPVVVSHYTLMSQTGSNCFPYSWDFSFSNDNENWTKIHEVRGSDILKPPTSIVFELPHPIIGKYFAWFNRGTNNCGTTNFYINELELFGNIAPFFEYQCTYMKIRHFPIVYLSVVISF